MSFSASKLNFFIALNLPSAFFSGVRVKSICSEKCVVRVKNSWFNKNPFKSMYWAVQGMAAELSTGALIITKIKDLKLNISMLVVKNEGNFKKKVKDSVIFKCDQGTEIEKLLMLTKSTNEGQIIDLKTNGYNSKGELVTSFVFRWSLKSRK